MKTRKGKTLQLILGAFLALAAPAVAQEDVVLTLDTARQIMVRAAQGDNPQLALAIAEEILAQNPDDRSALIVVGVAAPLLGDAARGQRAAQRAWWLSETPAQRYEAARVAALAANSAERYGLAGLWLRVALISAPDEASRSQTLRDAATVSQRNPWSVQVTGSLFPSNNVNGGADSDISSAPGNPTGTLSDDAIALSGWRGSFGLSFGYRLTESEKQRTVLGGQFNISRVLITEETPVPDAAFDSQSREISLRHDRALENGTISFSGALGSVDYTDTDRVTTGGSGSPFVYVTSTERYSFGRVGLERRLPLSDTAIVSLSYARELLRYENIAIGEINRNRLGASILQGLPSGDRLNLSYSLTDSVGDNTNYTSRENTVRLVYAWSEPIGPVSLSVGGGFLWADYPDYRLLSSVTGGRQDRTKFLEANIGFPGVSFAGFTPGLRIDLSRTDSNVSRFDRNTASVGFTISSQF